MDPADLAFFTSDELIAELMRRKTFLGVVIQSEQDFKQNNWGDERMFRVHFNGALDSPGVSRLLGRVAEYLDTHYA